MGKVARIVDIGLCEKLKEQDVSESALFSRFGDCLSEAASFVNSMSDRYLVEIAKAREEAKVERAEKERLAHADVARQGELDRVVADLRSLANELTVVKEQAEVDKAEILRLEARVELLEGEKGDLVSELAELRGPAAEAKRQKFLAKESLKCYQRGQYFAIRAFHRSPNFVLSAEEWAELLKTTNNVLVKDDHAMVPFDREELARLKEKCPDWQAPVPVSGNVVERFCSLRKIALSYDVPSETVLSEGGTAGGDPEEDVAGGDPGEDVAGGDPEENVAGGDPEGDVARGVGTAEVDSVVKDA